jgi:hypothetical protein
MENKDLSKISLKLTELYTYCIENGIRGPDAMYAILVLSISLAECITLDHKELNKLIVSATKEAIRLNKEIKENINE